MCINLFVILQKFKIVKLQAELGLGLGLGLGWGGGKIKQQLVKISELGQFYDSDRK